MSVVYRQLALHPHGVRNVYEGISPHSLPKTTSPRPPFLCPFSNTAPGRGHCTSRRRRGKCICLYLVIRVGFWF